MNDTEKVLVKTTERGLHDVTNNPEFFTTLQCHMLVVSMMPSTVNEVIAKLRTNEEYAHLEKSLVCKNLAELSLRGHVEIIKDKGPRKPTTIEGTLVIDHDKGTISFVPSEPRYVQTFGKVSWLAVHGLPTPIPDDQLLRVSGGKANWKSK
jgi:hypothetical protein